jgi:hypothetical protein
MTDAPTDPSRAQPIHGATDTIGDTDLEPIEILRIGYLVTPLSFRPGAGPAMRVGTGDQHLRGGYTRVLVNQLFGRTDDIDSQSDEIADDQGQASLSVVQHQGSSPQLIVDMDGCSRGKSTDQVASQQGCNIYCSRTGLKFSTGRLGSSGTSYRLHGC